MALLLAVAVLLMLVVACPAQDCQTSALQTVNRYRALHGVPLMTWDVNMAKSAQETANLEAADSCNIGDQWSEINGYEGVLDSSFQEKVVQDQCTASIQAMYRRVALYNFSDTPADDENPTSYTFSRLMWRGSTSIGCAVANGTYNGQTCSTVVCYLPNRNLSSVPDRNQAYRDNLQASALRSAWSACKTSSLGYLNQLRARHGLQNMSWDDSLAAAALDLATASSSSPSCQVANAYTPLGTDMMYFWSSNSAGVSPDCKTAVDAFYANGEHYNFTTPIPYETNGASELADIYAKLMWANTTHLGCGAATNNEGSCAFVLCLLPTRYFPTDNVAEANSIYRANAPAALPDLSKCKAAVLDRHNALRALHGSPPLQWDEDMATLAQTQAASSSRIGCQDDGSEVLADQDGITSTNLAWNGSDPCGLAVDRWYAGASTYNFSVPPNDGTDEDWFAKIIWASTSRVGCGAGVNYASGCSFVECIYPARSLPTDAAARQQAFLENVRASVAEATPPTPTPTPAPPAPVRAAALDGGKSNLGLIIGAAVGGIVLLAILVGALLLCRHSSKRKSSDTLLGGSAHRSADLAAAKTKPLVPGYQWVSQMAEGRSFLQAGVNDVQLDTQRQWLPQGWTSPVIQLTSEQVQDQIQLLSDMPMGSGACGHVYKCVWESRFPNALLAAKILPNTAKYYDLAWQSFQHETNILKAINHPNIVRIYGFCLDQPTVCIIMELLDFSVDRLVSSSSWLAGKLTNSTGVSTPSATHVSYTHYSTPRTPNTSVVDGSVVVSLNEPSASMTMKRVLRIAIDVAAGLEHLHADPGQRQSTAMSTQMTGASQEDTLALPSPDQIGVVIHRDIKPDNMLVNAVGQTKLCDFGISRETLGTVLQTRHEGAGTDRYMAPELLVYRNNSANSGVVGKKVDIYSLGIVLYELVSHRAITAREAQQVPSGVRPSLITKGDPEAVQARLRELECSEEVLKRVEGIITRCWHHLPNKRPTAAELRQALMEVQDSLAGQTGLTGQL